MVGKYCEGRGRGLFGVLSRSLLGMTEEHYDRNYWGQ